MSRWLVLALFLAAVVVIVQSIAPQTIGEQARRHIEKTFQDHYPQFDVSVGRCRYSPSVGLVFENISIADPSVSSESKAWGFVTDKPREIVNIKRLTVVADTNARRLLEKKNPLVTRRVVIEGIAVETWLTADGKLSLQQLMPLPVMGPSAPRVEVRGAKVRLVDLDGDASPVEIDLSEILVVNSTEQPTAVNDSAIATSSVAAIKQQPTVQVQTISIRGTSNHFGAMSFQARASKHRLKVIGKIDNARIGPQLIDCLPAAYRKPLDQARGLQCLCDLSLDLDHRPGDEAAGLAAQTDYRLTASVRQGRLEHLKLPKPITNLSGLVICQPSGLTVQGFQGLCGPAVCRVIDGGIDRYQWPEQAHFNASVSGLLLDDSLAQAIPSTMRTGWENLQPTGQIDIVDANLKFRDGRWMTNATVDCKGVDIRHAKFPYPVEQLVGRIMIRDSIAYADSIDGRIGGRRLRCGFRLPTDQSIVSDKSFTIATEGPIAIDATLLNALTNRGSETSKLETFVRSLNPRGAVHLTKANFSVDVDGTPHRDIEFQISDANLRYALFAYPLYNVSGLVSVIDDDVMLSSFSGANANAGEVLCQGTYRMPPAADQGTTTKPSRIEVPRLQPFTPEGMQIQAAPQLYLSFQAKNIPMDESLRASLPVDAQTTWNAISPGGVLDKLDVVLTQASPGTPIEMNITGIESESSHSDNRTLTIQPPSLPYRLDISEAQVNFDGNRVRIDSLRGRHGSTRLSTQGSCDRDENGRWMLSLGIDSGSRISPEAELIAALPIDMRNAMYQLQLQRPVSIRGPVSMLLADDLHPDPVINWDIVLQLEGNRIGDVGPVHDLRGELETKGLYDARGVRASGQIRIDSLHVDELQVTQIQGPYSIIGKRLRLGLDPQTLTQFQRSAAGQPPGNEVLPINRKIRGRLFGGEVELDGEVLLTTGGFDIALALNNGKVPELLAELGKGRSELTGTINGKVNLEGILGTTDLLKGVGSARVMGANLYQLPLLVQLLNLLRIKATEDVAFTDADVDFTLMEDTMTFNNLRLWGDLVALQGGGTLNRHSELDLTFNTQVSPHNVVTQVLSPLRKQNYTLWTVDVRGPLDAPTVHRSSLDSVGNRLQRFLPGLSGRPSSNQQPQSTASEGGLFR